MKLNKEGAEISITNIKVNLIDERGVAEKSETDLIEEKQKLFESFQQ